MSPDDPAHVIFNCPKDLDDTITNIAHYNMIERTDLIVLAAQELLNYLDQREDKQKNKYPSDEELGLPLF